MNSFLNLSRVSEVADFVEDRNDLKRKIEALRTLGVKIVLTQGAYDMVHTGHVRYLAKAKSHGDILIVAIDTDELVKSRKGPDRPFDSEIERFEIVRSLRSVDIVVPKTLQEDKHDIIKLIHPDIFVISRSTGDEIQKDIDEFGSMCGEVINLKPQSSNSTTAKFRRMKVNHGKELIKVIEQAVGKYLEGENNQKTHNED